MDKEDYTPRPATNSKPIYMNNVHCSGQELTLLDCSYSRNLSINEHHKDVGVQCRKCKLRILLQDDVGMAVLKIRDIKVSIIHSKAGDGMQQ